MQGPSIKEKVLISIGLERLTVEAKTRKKREKWRKRIVEKMEEWENEESEATKDGKEVASV